MDGKPESISEPAGRRPVSDVTEVFASKTVQLLEAPAYSTAYSFRVASVERRILKIVATAGSVKGLEPHVGDEVWVRRIAGGAVYEAPGRVTRGSQGQYVALTVQLLSKVMRVQRREFFRVRVLLEGELSGVYEDPTPARVENLSGGGGMVRCGRPFPAEELVYAKVRLVPGSPTVRSHSRVVWREPAGETEFLVGLHFIEIRSRDRERVIPYCLEVMRRQIHASRTGKTVPGQSPLP